MNSPNKSTPFISIVIPTYNRPQRLADCLDSLTKLEYPRDRFEVVIVDDGSKTSLESVVEPFQNQLEISLFKQTNSGPASARNTGAKEAKGDFLAFIDDDCKPASDWLNKLAARLIAQPDSMVGGQTLNALPDNLYSTASQLLIEYLYNYYNLGSKQSNFFASNNFALASKHFQTLNGFDTTFPLAAGEDREFCDRWLHHDFKMVYAPEVRVYHAHKLSLSKFWQQHFNYGRGAFCFHQVRAKRNNKPIEVEPVSFYFNLLTYPLSHSKSQPGILVSGLCFLSQIAGVAGFFWERRQQATN